MPAKPSKKTSQSYRELNERLDAVLAKLQDPDLDIDEASRVYEEGLATISQLEKRLHEAETTIQTIRANFDSKVSAD